MGHNNAARTPLLYVCLLGWRGNGMHARWNNGSAVRRTTHGPEPEAELKVLPLCLVKGREYSINDIYSMTGRQDPRRSPTAPRHAAPSGRTCKSIWIRFGADSSSRRHLAVCGCSPSGFCSWRGVAWSVKRQYHVARGGNISIIISRYIFGFSFAHAMACVLGRRAIAVRCERLLYRSKCRVVVQTPQYNIQTTVSLETTHA